MSNNDDQSSPPKTVAALMFFVAETPVHAGAESSGGAIDLPIQRERHTGWPCVFASGLKGAWKERAREVGFVQGDLYAVFGDEDSEYGGALSAGDLTVLALPVRSLNSNFMWVTCDAVLRRFCAAAKRLGFGALAHTLPEAAVPRDARGDSLPAALLARAGLRGRLVLEEFAFDAGYSRKAATWAKAIAQWTGLAPRVVAAGLVVVPDGYFDWYAENAVPVAAHVKLDKKVKKVELGPWYEETLPCDTMLYATVECSAARGGLARLNAAQVFEAARKAMPVGKPYLRVGGNESLGMGWGRTTWWPKP